MVKSSSSTPYCFVSGLTEKSNIAPPSKFVLTIRQQPQRGKVCGIKERDRRPIDPPPIVQIKLSDPASDKNKDYLQSPYLFMCCNLVHADNPSGEIVAPAHRVLAGTVVSSLNRLKDIDNSDGGYFVFGDVSVRIEGVFCLRFTLFELIEGQVVHIMTSTSSPLTIFTPKAFPGMLESTFLSRSFSDQGVRIRIRKDHHVKPKKPSIDGQDGSMHSPPSSTHEAEHSDTDLDLHGIHHKRTRSSLSHLSHDEPFHPYASHYPAHPLRHVAIAARPNHTEYHSSHSDFDRTPPSSPGQQRYGSVDSHWSSHPTARYAAPYPHPSPSAHGYAPPHEHVHAHHAHPTHGYGREGSPHGHAPSRTLAAVHSHSSSKSSSPSPSVYSHSPRHHPYPHPPSHSYSHPPPPAHNYAHGRSTAQSMDHEMEYTPSAHSPRAAEPYRSRTPSMTSQHSDGNTSPPHPCSPPESQAGLRFDGRSASPPSPRLPALPAFLPRLAKSSTGGDKIQLPPIHMLSTTGSPRD
ncbi:hypothetical protein BGW38_008077 [Lunasporangiospora selenospora]|uniref:Velvet domain-containing protein n=1 Tax=Lunasporangiospora selenospora TaxID=979761 RepID=A0A9P6KGD3_9FUNG|nr:hypothetical protein BGW38_008077 [Lunasporangiospora selenospora]